ncbi:MAG TPA: toprim domain-containing protein, partial [Abditibacteriaceae bacterium]
ERDRLQKIAAAAASFFREQFAGNKGLDARDYARRRGLSPNTLEKFGIGYAPDAWDGLHHYLVNKYGFKPGDAASAGLLVERENEDPNRSNRYYDRYRHRLMFPIWDPQGRVVAFGGRALEGGKTGTPDAKYINSPEGPLFNKSRTLYAWHLARGEIGKRESVIVTEGYMDAIALHEAGFGNTIATLGTALTTQHVAALARLSPKTVYLCYDGDSAGMRAALRAAPLFSAQNLTIRVVTLPGGEDPDTYIKKFGAVSFEGQLRNARMLSRYRLEMAVAEFDMSNVSERMEAMRAAAEVVAEVENDIEKDDYIAWLADRWGAAEGVTAPTRLQMIQAAVRREVASAGKRRRESNYSQNYQPGAKQQAREAENQDVSETLANSGSSKLSGVAKAERILLSSLLGNPSWRTRILNDLPPERWTEEVHREVAAALRQVDFNAPVDPALLIDTLPPEAGGLVGELMMNDESQSVATAEVIEDCVARVLGHWARQIERETLEMLQLKLDRAEPISEEERLAYNNALLATRRKLPPVADKK